MSIVHTASNKSVHTFSHTPATVQTSAHEVSRGIREAINVLKSEWDRSASNKDLTMDEGNEPYLALFCDSDLLLQYLDICLRDLYNIVMVHSLKKLCKRADLENCLVVVTDLCTNERTHFEIQKTMQSGHPLDGIPVLLISQESGFRSKHMPTSFQPDTVLSMPTTRTQVREAVADLVK